MNSIFSTKDKTALLIQEEMMSKDLKALVLTYDGDTGTVEVKIAREGMDDVTFNIDSLKAMEALSYFMFDKFKEAQVLAESGNNQTRVKLNDEAVQSLWIKMNQEGKNIRS